MATCPACRAESVTSDYCDSCGAAVVRASHSRAPGGGDAGPATVAVAMSPAPAAPPSLCPGCGLQHNPADLFCEACGADFTTGAPPAAAKPEESPPGTGSGWVAEVDADRAFFDANLKECGGDYAFPAQAVRREVPLRHDEVVIGRHDDAAGSVPTIDLSLDPGVSRRHAVLRCQPDDTWVLTDTGSTNGTLINGHAEPVKPDDPVPLHDGDRIRLGLFSVITVRTERKAGS